MRELGAFALFVAWAAVGLLSAADLTVEEILARVAENQARSEQARSSIVYEQEVLVRLLKDKGKLAREEEHHFTVTPTPDGQEKTRTYFRGVLRHKGELLPYAEPHFERGKIDIDADLSETMLDLTNDRSKDGVARSFFPLTKREQRKYSFRLLGVEDLDGRPTYRIAFAPKRKGSLALDDDGHWKGEVFVDRERFQPVYLHSGMASKVPLLIRTLLGTNVKQVGFALRYEEVEEGLWFPVSYGGEFRIRGLFFYVRTVTLSMVNQEFRRTEVDSRVEFENEPD